MELVTITEDDLPLIRAVNTDPLVMGHLGGVLTEKQVLNAHRAILKALDNGGWCFKIVLAAEQGHDETGTLLVWRSEWEQEPVWEIGWIVRPAFQRRGVASEAVRTLIDRARAKGQFDAIHAFPGVDNVASNRICEKSGFTNLGECEVDYAGRIIKSYHWCIEL